MVLQGRESSRRRVLPVQTSISVALNDSASVISEIPPLQHLLSFLLLQYSEECRAPAQITAKFIRYLAGLEMHNVEAEERGPRVFPGVHEFSSHIYESNCWGDQSIMQSILKSLRYRISLVVLDFDLGAPVSMPITWTHRKDLYIFLS